MYVPDVDRDDLVPMAIPATNMPHTRPTPTLLSAHCEPTLLAKEMVAATEIMTGGSVQNQK